MRVSEVRIIDRATLKAGFPARTCRSGSNPSSSDCESTINRGLLLPTIVTESEDTVRILLPLCGVDLRHVYVIASPRSVAIEIRAKKMLDHAGLGVVEIQDERIIRELRLHLEIKEGSTSVRTLGDALEITCLRADAPDDRAWSELVRFNTRGSLGCV